MKYKYLKILVFNLFLFVMIIGFASCAKKYDILEAPISNKEIADYEKIFSKVNYNFLIKKVRFIREEYNVKIYFLSVYSFHDLEKKYDFIMERVNEILNLRDENLMKEKIIIFLFSHNDRHNSDITSIEFRNVVNEQKFDAIKNKIIAEYFLKHEYFNAFKEIFEAIDNELSKNRV